MFIVYVLLSYKDNKLYIGYTTNLEQRLAAHTSGSVLSTKHRRPLRLLYAEHFINKWDALRREGYFKTTAGKKALKLMLRETLQQEKI